MNKKDPVVDIKRPIKKKRKKIIMATVSDALL